MGRYAKNTEIKSGSYAIRLPVGSTGLRPDAPVDGQIRFNQTTNQIEFYYSGNWRDVAKIGKVALDVDQFVGDNNATQFTMSKTVALSTDVYVTIGGVYQIPDVNYTVAGSYINFTSAPPAPSINPNKIIVIHGMNSTDVV